MKLSNYEPIIVYDNQYNPIGEVIQSMRNKSYNGLTFSIYDQIAATAALHRVVSIGDISKYKYIDLHDKQEITLLKQFNVTGKRFGATTGISYFKFENPCNNLGPSDHTWNIVRRIFETRNTTAGLSFRELQYDNLYCYYCKETIVENGDCGALSIVTIDGVPIILGLHVEKLTNSAVFDDAPFHTMGAIQDISSFFKVLKIKNPFAKVSLKSLKSLNKARAQYHHDDVSLNGYSKNESTLPYSESHVDGGTTMTRRSLPVINVYNNLNDIYDYNRYDNVTSAYIGVILAISLAIVMCACVNTRDQKCCADNRSE